MNPPVAVVDCGTNTTRLLITDGREDIRRERVTGLGRGLGASGNLSAAAIDRVLDALGDFRTEIEDAGVRSVRVVATSAARDAGNRDDFFGPAQQRIGVSLDLLDGEEEARYSFAGATAGLDPLDGPYLVVDIGGGSTELAIGRAAMDACRSIDVGSVRFTERYLRSDPPAPEELSAAISVVRLHLDDVAREAPSMARPCRLVGVAGTVTTVAAVEIGLDVYDPGAVDGFVLERAAAEDVFRTLATESLADRVHNPGLVAERADVIVGGCCILVAIMRHWEHDNLLVRERDLLDGIAAELLGSAR